jgi:muramidase (phage lysozyme)
LIDEIGATTQFPAAGQPTQNVFVVAMRASTTGVVQFTPQFATSLGREVILFGDAATTLIESDIQFVASNSLTITTANPQPQPTVTITDQSITEGDSGTKNMTFTVTVSNSNYNTRVNYATQDVTATNNPPAPGLRDYNATSGVLTFLAGGPTSQTVTVQIRGDLLAESPETFNVNLTSLLNINPTGSKTTGVGTITSEATDVPGISINTQTVNESAGTMTFTVTRSPNATGNSTVVFTTVDGTASAGRDYTGVSGTLTFGNNDNVKTITVPITNDTIREVDENFFISLSSPTNAVVLTNSGQGTIVDNDPAALAGIFINSPAGVTEGNSGTKVLNFTVTLSAPVTQNVTVNYQTANVSATAGSDYVATSGILTFVAGGSRTLTIPVTINGDTTAEADETFRINLTSPAGAQLENTFGTGTILNDDGAVAGTLSIGAAVAQNEGNAGTTSFVYPVTLSANPVSNVTVVVTTSNGTATTADGDYQALTQTLTFTPGGSLTQNVTVLVNGDTKDENNETFNVTLSNAVGATIGTAGSTGTIQNDDIPPVLSIGNVSLTEGNAGTKTFSFPVTLSQASGKQITVAYTTANGTAAAGSDYTTTSGILTIAAGATTGTINVSVTGDTTSEADETFFVNLSSPTNVTLTGGGATLQATGTIQNDDLNISIGPGVSQNEGNAGTTNFVIPVTLSANPSSVVTVVVTTSNGTATTADGDYQALTQTLTFNPGGSLTQNVTVLVNGDTKDENNETFNVSLSNPTNASITTASVVGTIQNDDIPPVLTIGNVSLTEGNAGTKTFSFPVNLSQASGKQITVAYTTANGTATAGSDYTTTSGILTIAAGATSGTINVSVLGDTTSEVDETFFVNLSSPTNVTLSGGGATLQATGTIQNDDINVSIGGPISQNEGNAGTTSFVFPVTISSNPTSNVTVVVATSNGSATTADGDYQSLTQTLTFTPGGSLTQNVTVLVNGDTKDENNEAFNVTLSNAVGASITNASSSGTIQNDDVPPVLSIGNVSLTEGNAGTKTFAFNVTLSQASSKQITVAYTTANGTATAGSDYTTTSGILTIAAGATSGTINVSVLGDTTSEVDETFFVNLSSPTNVTLSGGGSTLQATGTIQNDDAVPGLSIGNVSQAEGNAGTTAFVFNVFLSPASGQVVTVEYQTVAGTAAEGTDFTATNGTLTFQPGETSKPITVLVQGDLVNEANEAFTVVLSNPVNTFIASGQGTATGTVQNDDLVTVSITDVSQNEGNAGNSDYVFNVTLSAASDQQVEVVYSTGGGTATANVDYVAQTGTLTFAPGETSKNIVIQVLGDTAYELDETFNVTLQAPTATGVSLAKAIGGGSILNDDALPVLSIDNVTELEGSGGGFKSFVFTVSLAGDTALPVTVQYSTANGTAITPSDYTATSGQLTFNPGETSKTITVQVRQDNILETDETFFVNLSGETNASVATAQGVGTILQDGDIIEFEYSSLTGMVWLDSQYDGVKHANEKALAGVTVRLIGESDASGEVFLETTTDANGNYKFEELEPGDYKIVQVQPGFYADGVSQAGTINGTTVGSSTGGSGNEITLRLEGGEDGINYNFTERSVRSELISKRFILSSTLNGTELGSQTMASGDVEFAAQKPGSNGVWYSIDAGFDGILTVLADGQDGGGDTRIAIYDNNLNEVASTTGANGDARLDFTAPTDEPYFVRVYGANDSVQVRMVNLLNQTGDVLNVRGTSGDDAFSFNAQSYLLSINGVDYSIDKDEVSELNFNGGAGTDTADLIDSALNDLLDADGGTLQLENADLLVTLSEIEQARATASSGGTNTKNVLATDYALELIGDWI